MFAGMYIEDKDGYINKFKSKEKAEGGRMIINSIKNELLNEILKKHSGNKIKGEEEIDFFEFKSEGSAKNFIKEFSTKIIKEYPGVKAVFVSGNKKENIKELVEEKVQSGFFSECQISFGREILETENGFPAVIDGKYGFLSEEGESRLKEAGKL